jgi:hypothetical protein
LFVITLLFPHEFPRSLSIYIYTHIHIVFLLLCFLLQQLGIGEGGGTVVSKKDEEGAIRVMMEVLQIPREQAQFFLESANNDIVIAVDLHFELIGSENNAGKRHRHDPNAFSNFMGNVASGSGYSPANNTHQWQNRDVSIAANHLNVIYLFVCYTIIVLFQFHFSIYVLK